MTGYEYLIGMSLEVARNAIKSDKKLLRVVIKDGKHQLVTHDHNVSRINVETRNDIIISIVNMG